jgi:hypothetical protein
MEQVFAQWRMRANVLGKRFVFTTLPENSFEAYQHLTELASALTHESVRQAKPKPLDRMMFNDAVSRGGFTYQPHDRAQPIQGFSVGVHRDHGGVAHEVDLADLQPSHLAGHRRAGGNLFRNGYQGHPVYQGAWLDRMQNKVYLDASHVVPDEHTARDLGIHHRQMAYYDLGRNQSVYFDPQRDPHMHKGTPAEHQEAIEKYARVSHEFGKITPDAYWGYHEQEFGPVPGEKEAKAYFASYPKAGSQYGLPLPYSPVAFSSYVQYLRDHPLGPSERERRSGHGRG